MRTSYDEKYMSSFQTTSFGTNCLFIYSKMGYTVLSVTKISWLASLISEMDQKSWVLFRMKMNQSSIFVLSFNFDFNLKVIRLAKLSITYFINNYRIGNTCINKIM